MKSKLGLLAILLTLTLSSCDFGNVLPSVTGSQFEVLAIVNDSTWKTPGGQYLKELLTSDMEGLPQAESVFDVSRFTHYAFSDMFKATRNIIMVEVSNRYTAPKIVFGSDRWAHPQAIITLVAPDNESFETLVKQQGANIVNYFVAAERNRQISYNKDNINLTAKQEIEKMFGIQIDIPKGIATITKHKDFLWITNEQATVNQNIVVYSYPYTDPNTFTKEFLIAKRDSMMKNIPGELEGSYMGTENYYSDVQFSEIGVNKGYCAELRGLWKMENGLTMGGPFVSHTRLDEVNQRVITTEIFVFAPAKKKRNPVRQLEAVLYTSKLPQEINQLNEVSITATKAE